MAAAGGLLSPTLSSLPPSSLSSQPLTGPSYPHPSVASSIGGSPLRAEQEGSPFWPLAPKGTSQLGVCPALFECFQGSALEGKTLLASWAKAKGGHLLLFHPLTTYLKSLNSDLRRLSLGMRAL